MTTGRPVIFQWDGESMVPRSPRLADREYTVGETYPLVIHEDRSTNTHNHQFAWLHDAWLNLPEDLADLYPTAEHLRKRALIEAGYYNEAVIDCGSKAGALRVAAHLKSKDDFALVIVRGPLVVERTAKSQSRRAMNKDEFNKSKQAVLEVVASLLDLTPDALSSDRSAPSAHQTKPAAKPASRIAAGTLVPEVA